MFIAIKCGCCTGLKALAKPAILMLLFITQASPAWTNYCQVWPWHSLKNAYPTRWQGLAQYAQKLQLLAFIAVAIMLYLLLNYGYIEGQGYGFFATVFGYSLLAMAFALLLASALQPGSLLAKYRIPGAATLALWSYSLYLVHKPIGFIITTQAKTTGWSSNNSVNSQYSVVVNG